MAINKTKVAQNAQKLVQKGQFEKAIKEYATLVKDDPKDLRSQLKIAELHSKLNRKDEAVKAFQKVAEQYNKSGFYAKAVAVLRQAIDVDKENVKLYIFLSELQEKLGMMRDAVVQLNTAARLYQDAGKHDDALGIFERMKDLDPEDPSVLARYGEALYHAGRQEEAVEIFRSLIATLKAADSNDDLVRFCERILVINPDDADILRELSRTYVRIGLANKALLKLKALFDRNVIDAELYDLLDRSYTLLGKSEKALHAKVEKAKYLHSQGDTATACAVYEEVLLEDPGNQEATSFLESQKPKAPAAQKPPEPEPAPKAAASEPTPAPVEKPASAPSHDSGSSGSAYGTASKQLSKFLTEADVYLKYGLRDKAIDQLEAVLDHDPNNVGARSRLVEIYTDEHPVKAAEHLRALAEISEGLGEIEQAQGYLERADGLAPEKSGGALDDELILGDEPAQDEEEVVEEADVSIEDDVVVEAGEDDLEVEVEVEVDEPDDEAGEVIVGAEAPGEADFGDLGSELDAELGDDFLDSASPEEEGVSEAAAADAPDVQEQMDEADFYIQQGIHAEAQAIYETILASHPGHAKAKEMLAWVQEQQAASDDKPTEAAAPSQTAEAGEAHDADDEPLFDLAAELESELDFGEEEPATPAEEEAPSFEDIFTQFKKGVERELQDDSSAHYDLGIAYKEMGLVPDAIEEFKTAMADESREAECCTMIALCYQEQGQQKEAISYYQRAIESKHSTPDIVLNTHYELACLYEAVEDTRNAVGHFKKVIEKDKNYRDVSERIRALKARVKSGKAYA